MWNDAAMYNILTIPAFGITYYAIHFIHSTGKSAESEMLVMTVSHSRYTHKR